MDIFNTVLSAKGKESPKEIKAVDTENRDLLVEERTKDSFSGIPEDSKSRMWNVSIEEDGENNKLLSFLVGDKVMGFKLGDKDENGNLIASRIPDADSHDFGTRGDAMSGKFQVYKTSPSLIYGTWQAGKSNITFSLSKGEDGNWRIQKKGEDVPMSDVLSLISSIKTKVAAVEYAESGRGVEPNMNLVKALDPEYHSLRNTAAAGAITGALLMAAKNIGQKSISYVGGYQDDSPSILRDILLGAAGGGVGLGALKYMGTQGSINDLVNMDGTQLPREIREKYHNIAPRKMRSFLVDEDIPVRVVSSGEKASQDAFNKGASHEDGIEKRGGIDVYMIESILRNDRTLSEADRRLLMYQLNKAYASLGPGGLSSMDRLKSVGLSALAGYIAAKILGLGTFGTIGSSILGGLIGLSGGGGTNPSRGGFATSDKGYNFYNNR